MWMARWRNREEGGGRGRRKIAAARNSKYEIRRVLKQHGVKGKAAKWW